MPLVLNVDGLEKKIEELGRANKDKCSIAVGYTANYALHVHENIEMRWRGFPRSGEVRLIKGIAYTGYSAGSKKGNYWDGTGGATGQAKFLEQPFRELRDEMSRLLTVALGNGATLEQSLYIIGLRLQRESQLLVPVDSGNLKASAFTRKD